MTNFCSVHFAFGRVNRPETAEYMETYTMTVEIPDTNPLGCTVIIKNRFVLGTSCDGGGSKMFARAHDSITAYCIG